MGAPEKPLEKLHSHVLKVMLTESQYKWVKEQAALKGVSVSEFARGRILAK